MKYSFIKKTILSVVIGVALCILAACGNTNDNKTIPLTDKELQYFSTEFFNQKNDICIPNMFLATEFEDVKNVNLCVVFYDGISWELNAHITDAEKVAINDAKGREAGLDYIKVPVNMMNNVLRQYTGYVLDETHKNNLNTFVYLESYDAFYLTHGDTYMDYYIFTSGEKTDVGLITLHYESVTHSGLHATGSVTLQETENGFLFVCNKRD